MHRSNNISAAPKWGLHFSSQKNQTIDSHGGAEKCYVPNVYSCTRWDGDVETVCKWLELASRHRLPEFVLVISACKEPVWLKIAPNRPERDGFWIIFSNMTSCFSVIKKICLVHALTTGPHKFCDGSPISLIKYGKLPGIEATQLFCWGSGRSKRHYAYINLGDSSAYRGRYQSTKFKYRRN